MYLVQKAMETAASDSLILSNGLPHLLGISMHKVVTSSLSVGDQDEKGHQGHLKENWTLRPWGFKWPTGSGQVSQNFRKDCDFWAF